MKYLTDKVFDIIQGDSMSFAGGGGIEITFISQDIDLNGFYGSFDIGSIFKKKELEQGKLFISLNSDETICLPIGEIDASICVFDTQGNKKTEGLIRFNILSPMGC